MGQLPLLQVEKIHPLQVYISLLSQSVDLYGINCFFFENAVLIVDWFKSGTKFFVSFPCQEGQRIKFWFKHSRKTVFLRSQMGQLPLLRVKKIHLVTQVCFPPLTVDGTHQLWVSPTCERKKTYTQDKIYFLQQILMAKSEQHSKRNQSHRKQRQYLIFFIGLPQAMMQCRRNGRQSINLILDLTILINIGRLEA